MKKRYVVEYGQSVLGRPKRKYFDTLPEAEVFTSAYFQRRNVVLGIEEVKRGGARKMPLRRATTRR